MKNKRAEVQTVGTRRDASAGADLKSRLKSHAVTIENNGHTLEAENNRLTAQCHRSHTDQEAAHRNRRNRRLSERDVFLCMFFYVHLFEHRRSGDAYTRRPR